VARKFGAVRDTVLAFGSGRLYQDEGDTFYSLASRLKIGGYFNLGRNLDDWRTWLATKGPILTRLDVDRTWYEATDNAGKLDAYRPETGRGGHAVALVGYTTNRFVVRNSWGTDWGDDGFAYASQPYALAAFTEAYGVSL
jgi:Papain family cysteine protease